MFVNSITQYQSHLISQSSKWSRLVSNMSNHIVPFLPPYILLAPGVYPAIGRGPWVSRFEHLWSFKRPIGWSPCPASSPLPFRVPEDLDNHQGKAVALLTKAKLPMVALLAGAAQTSAGLLPAMLRSCKLWLGTSSRSLFPAVSGF